MTEWTIPEALATDATVRLAAEGDEAAFTRLVARHDRAMVKVAYAITVDVEAAQDATQQAWAIAWRRLPTLRNPDQVGAWLVAIAANEARQIVRGRRRRPVVDISDDLQAPAGVDPASSVEVLDLARQIRVLDADDRMLLALRFVAGLDSNEIAAQLGMSASG